MRKFLLDLFLFLHLALNLAVQKREERLFGKPVVEPITNVSTFRLPRLRIDASLARTHFGRGRSSRDLLIPAVSAQLHFCLGHHKVLQAVMKQLTRETGADRSFLDAGPTLRRISAALMLVRKLQRPVAYT